MRDVIAAATERLREAGVESPEHDARALAAHVLGCTLKQLPMHDTLDEAAYGELVTRRAARVPLQHLTGSVASAGSSSRSAPVSSSRGRRRSRSSSGQWIVPSPAG